MIHFQNSRGAGESAAASPAINPRALLRISLDVFPPAPARLREDHEFAHSAVETPAFLINGEIIRK
jgi:hypothetical protein